MKHRIRFRNKGLRTLEVVQLMFEVNFTVCIRKSVFRSELNKVKIHGAVVLLVVH